MAMKINQSECASCGDCKKVCPTQSITEKGGIFKINKDTCTECDGVADSPQCVTACSGGDRCIAYL